MRLPLLPLVLWSVSAYSTTAEQGLLSGFSTARPRISEADASCISVAAGLVPCLSAGSPHSRLTTMEEADCCTTLLVFKEATCFCLPPESVQQLTKADRCALKSRLNDLAEANRRCGWEDATCPVPDVQPKLVEHVGRKVGLEGKREGNDWADLAADLARFYGQGGTPKDVGFASQLRHDPGSLEVGSHKPEAQSQSQGTTLPRTEAEKRDALFAQMTKYVNRVVKLTEELSIDRGEEVDLTIEVTMGNTKFAAPTADLEAAPEDGSAGYRFWVWVVGFVGAMAVVAAVLCASEEWGRRACKRHPRRHGLGVGVVIAADEVHGPRKLVV